MCGGVTYEASGKLRDVFNCHCDRCRRSTGHFMAATATAPENVTFVASASLRWYAPAPGVEYGFCGTCGSTLFWRNSEQLAKLCIAAGTLDQPTGLQTTHAWYVTDASDYHQRQPGLVESLHED